ncbi:asparaginase [Corynebacterium callunae]|uniref:asparaginase n=1 Tax=Corynebacterium callunae TaxID=1721 RepID=UPI001FFE5E6A|nr:asparaginase [Corynebacterium callunae]MCK2199840.1 asparaginase [Corynebacterium callunae]
MFYPRSALKPLFAVGMLRAGLQLNSEQLALAAASHSGSIRHQEVALSTLVDAGLKASDLGNSTDLPYGTAEREEHLRADFQATQLAQNCSGKHAALLALCQLKGWDTKNYLVPEHPISQLLRETIAELCQTEITAASTDGCGTPVYPISLKALARGYSKLQQSTPGSAEAQVAQAMSAHPELVAGENRDVTALMRALPGAIAKDGFEGIQAVALPDGRALALKIADGGDRARLPITISLLSNLLQSATPMALESLRTLPVTAGVRQENVGKLYAL